MSLDDVASALLYNARSLETIKSDSQNSSAVLSQYELYVEMADRISNRRQTTNSFFLSLNSAIISLGGYTVIKAGPDLPVGLVILTASAGGMISLLWLRLILSYRDLNSAKFEVIHALEKLLPVSPYDAEWHTLGRGKKSRLYLPFSHVELWVPVGFVIIHVLGAAVVISARP